MIVLDENLQDRRIIESFARWYPGQVVCIRDLRPKTIIKDEAVTALLQRANEPTFITINTTDFWLKAQGSNSYCILTLDLAKERSLEISGLVRDLFRRDEFKTKSARMGKVIRWTPTRVEYYDSNRRVISIDI